MSSQISLLEIQHKPLLSVGSQQPVHGLFPMSACQPSFLNPPFFCISTLSCDYLVGSQLTLPFTIVSLFIQCLFTFKKSSFVCVCDIMCVVFNTKIYLVELHVNRLIQSNIDVGKN